MGMGLRQQCMSACLNDCLGSDKGLAGVQEPQQSLNDAVHVLHLCACPPQSSVRVCEKKIMYRTNC